MASIYYSSDGNIVTLFRNKYEENYGPRPLLPKIDFDEKTNNSLIFDLWQNASSYVVVSGLLFKNNSPVLIHPNGPDLIRSKLLNNIVSEMESEKGTNIERIRRCELILLHIIKNEIIKI